MMQLACDRNDLHAVRKELDSDMDSRINLVTLHVYHFYQSSCAYPRLLSALRTIPQRRFPACHISVPPVLSSI